MIELNNSTNETVGVEDGYHQLETHKMRIHNYLRLMKWLLQVMALILKSVHYRFMTWHKDGETKSSSSLLQLRRTDSWDVKSRNLT